MATVTKIRFLIDNVQGGVSHSNVAIAEVELRASVGGVDETTNTGGTATASGNIGAGYEASKAVDDNNATMWNCAFTAGSSWWAFELNSSIDLVEYSITSRSSYLDDTPTEWKLQYWNGSAWVTLIEQFTSADWGSNEKRVFDLTHRILSFQNIAQIEWQVPGKIKSTQNIAQVEWTVGGWAGKVCGVTNPAKINGVAVANIAKVIGV